MAEDQLYTTLKKGFRLAAVLIAFVGPTAVLADEPRIEDLEFHSEVLGKDMPFTLVRPADEVVAHGAVLFLLHGRGRHNHSLMESDEARAALLAAPFYIVLPKGEDGWYINSPVVAEARYEDYLLEVMRVAEQHAPLSRDPRWRAITGWSMGGYGAVRFAERHPEEIGTVSSIIGLLDFPRMETLPEGQNYTVPTARFGSDSAVWSKFNPINAVEKLIRSRLMLITGSTAFDRTMNYNFAARARQTGVSARVVELKGGHTIEVVTTALPIALQFIQESFADVKQPKANSLQSEARQRPRRLIFNNDSGGDARVPSAPTLTPEAFLAPRIAPLVGSQVDGIALDTTAGTFGTFGHRTQVAEMFTTREGRYRYNILPDFLKQNTDPLNETIKFARSHNLEVLWVQRMDDTHDASNPILFPAFKRDHPEILFGTPDNPPKYGKWSAVDYAEPAVRELAYAIVAEVAENYDVDGVELDFWRHPVFFKRSAQGEALRPEDRSLMTEVIRRMRFKLDEIGRARGKYLLLNIKYPDSVGYCFKIGLDLEQWLKEDLVDVLVPGGYFQLNPWQTSVALGEKYNVPVWACLAENRVRDPRGNTARGSAAALRARAAAAWTAGVDAIEMFNHFDPHKSYWHELGSLDSLRDLPKTYFVSVQGEGSATSWVPTDEYITLPGLTPDEPELIPSGSKRSYDIYLGDDLRKSSALTPQLRIQLSDTSGSTAAEVRWHGTALVLKPDGPGDYTASLDPSTIVPGRHRIELLNSGNADVEIGDLMVELILTPGN
jgi:enterochelin esterase-like enzyme